MSRSKRENGYVSKLSITEVTSELSSKHLMIVSSIESTNEGLMKISRRKNQMTRYICYKSATINVTVQLCTNELKTEIRD